MTLEDRLIEEAFHHAGLWVDHLRLAIEGRNLSAIKVALGRVSSEVATAERMMVK